MQLRFATVYIYRRKDAI